MEIEYPPRPEPLRIEFELTNHCNADCEFCPRFNIKEKGFMDLYRFKKFIDEFSIIKKSLWLNKRFPNQNFPTIVFGGYGEALAHPSFDQFIKHSKEKGFKTELITNGYLLNEERCKKLIYSGLEQLSISLHTLNGEINRRIMGINSIPKIERALRYLDNSSLNIEIWRVSKLDGSVYDPSEKEGDFDRFLQKYSKKICVLGPTPAWNRGGQYKSDFYPLVKDSDEIRCHTGYFSLSTCFNGDFILCCCDFSQRSEILAHQWGFNFKKIQERISQLMQNPPKICENCRKPKDMQYLRLIEQGGQYYV